MYFYELVMVRWGWRFLLVAILGRTADFPHQGDSPRANNGSRAK